MHVWGMHQTQWLRLALIALAGLLPSEFAQAEPAGSRAVDVGPLTSVVPASNSRLDRQSAVPSWDKLAVG